MGFLLARFDGLMHKLKGHKVEWAMSPMVTCKGDIVCHTCNVVLWCRWLDPKWLGGGKYD